MTDLKSEVQKFWDLAPCGEIYAKGDNIEEKLLRHAEERYRLEPYIREFARFAEGAGRDVLEIGTGMGADHLEWAKSGPRRLVGVDLTPGAVGWTARRLHTHGFSSSLSVADAEDLPFENNSFDIVYSWGVLHHSPDTRRAFHEAYRVLRPGGVLRAMIYHRPSFVGIMLWVRYGLATGKLTRSLADIYASHLESPGTKGYSLARAQELVADFRTCDIRCATSFGDLLLGEAGQQHRGISLTIARRLWPRPLIRRLPGLGLLLLIEARK